MPREARFPRELALGNSSPFSVFRNTLLSLRLLSKKMSSDLLMPAPFSDSPRISSSVQTMSAVWLSLYSEGAILRTSTFVRYAQSTVLMRSVTRA